MSRETKRKRDFLVYTRYTSVSLYAFDFLLGRKYRIVSGYFVSFQPKVPADNALCERAWAKWNVKSKECKLYYRPTSDIISSDEMRQEEAAFEFSLVDARVRNIQANVTDSNISPNCLAIIENHIWGFVHLGYRVYPRRHLV